MRLLTSAAGLLLGATSAAQAAFIDLGTLPAGFAFSNSASQFAPGGPPATQLLIDDDYQFTLDTALTVSITYGLTATGSSQTINSEAFVLQGPSGNLAEAEVSGVSANASFALTLLPGTYLVLFTGSAISDDTLFEDANLAYDFSIATDVVPLPAPLALLGAGLAGLAAARRRRG